MTDRLGERQSAERPPAAADDTIALAFFRSYSSVISTRRFCALPAAVALVATGLLAP